MVASLLLIFLGVVAVAAVDNTPVGGGCGFHSTPEQRAIFKEAIDTWDAEHPAAERIGEDSEEEDHRLLHRILKTELPEISYIVKVFIHVIGFNETEANALTRARKKKVMRWLKHGFRDSPFSFDLIGTEAIVDRRLFLCETEFDSRISFDIADKYNVGSKDVLNLYFCTQFSTWGYASGPVGLRGDGVFITHVDSYVDQHPSEDEDNLEFVVIHEVGHWLGLLHTFENYCSFGQEFNFSNPCVCDPINDGVKDTPAHGIPSIDFQESFSCFRDDQGQIGELPDSCPGLPGPADPVDNYMNYIPHNCSEHAHFTTGQINAMKALWQRARYVADPNPGLSEASAWRILSHHINTRNELLVWAVDNIQFFADKKCKRQIDLSDGATVISVVDVQNRNNSNVYFLPSFVDQLYAFDEDEDTIFAIQALEDPWIGVDFPRRTGDVKVQCAKFNQPESIFDPQVSFLGRFNNTYSTSISLQARRFGSLVWEPVATATGLEPGEGRVQNKAPACIELILNRCQCRKPSTARSCRKLAEKKWQCQDKEDGGCLCGHEKPGRCVKKLREKNKKCKGVSSVIKEWQRTIRFRC